MRYLALALVAVSLISCNRDPNYLKQKYLQSGIKYFDGGRYKEASIMFRKSIEADRKFGPAYYRLALTDLKQGLVPNAVPAFRRAHELLKPGTEEANDTDLKLSEIMIIAAQAQENNEQILKEVQQNVDGLLKRNPRSWEGHKLSGDLAMLATAKLYRQTKVAEAKQQLGMAIAEYRQAFTMKPGDPVITLALGRSLVVDGEAAEAESLFNAMIDKDKQNLNGYYELYRIYLSQRKIPEAEAILKKAIQNNPKDPQLRLTLAQFYYGTNKRPELVALLNQMKGNLKQFPNAYLQSGDFYLRVKDIDNALKQYEEGIQKDSGRKNVYLKHEIEAYVVSGKTALAYDKNEQILKNDPKDPEARGLRATFMLDRGDVNNAMGELQSVVTAKPNNYVAHFNLGRAHFARGEYEQARQEFDSAAQLRPDYIPARLAQIQVSLLRRDNDAALRQADETLRIAPNNVQARVMKAASLERLQRNDEARGLLTAVLDKQPKQVDTLLELGVLDLTEKKNKEAEDLFHRAYEADPNNLRGLLGESRALLLDNQPEKSVQLVETEFQKKPGNLDLQREVGNTQMSAGQYDKAVVTYQALMAKVSNQRQQSDLWTRIGESYLRKGDVEQAINSLEKARSGQPNNTVLTTNLGQLYDMDNKFDLARKYYEMSIKIDPNNALALNNLAYLMSQTNGDLDQALTYATRAKQRLPEHSEVNDTLGLIYIRKNLTDQAIDTFRNLVVKAPQNPTYHYHYAMALLQKGDRDTAKKECQSALADKPGKQQENDIKQLLAKVG
ncbi:MAG TPA: tetratricopeptide repeat protein [Bryobacteraceae bacterium]|jgi:tetratricopeptide (TPR) repeat protein|nr:tetratricopeptide repeat protein [Bryobacteraceae bacterium]